MQRSEHSAAGILIRTSSVYTNILSTDYGESAEVGLIVFRCARSLQYLERTQSSKYFINGKYLELENPLTILKIPSLCLLADTVR